MNPVAKNINKFNKPSTHVDKKKLSPDERKQILEALDTDEARGLTAEYLAEKEIAKLDKEYEETH